MIALDGIMNYRKHIAVLSADNSCGEVLLVTSKGAYLRFSNHVFFLSDARFGATPIGIILENIDFLTRTHVEVGQTIHCHECSITLSDLVIKLQLEEYKVTHTLLLPERIPECAKLLAEHNNPRGVSSLCSKLLLADQDGTYTNSLCTAAHPPLNQLMQGMLNNNQLLIHSAVKSLLGMGIGLTPSLDDVILGMLYTLKRLAPQQEVTQILTAAIQTFPPPMHQ